MRSTEPDSSHLITLPALFIGHGNPMNALQINSYTEGWQRIGREIPRPKAILAISAHWYVPGTGVTISTSPKTIHDFGGFPQELFQVQYPAPGDPELARRVHEMLAPCPSRSTTPGGSTMGRGRSSNMPTRRRIFPSCN